MLREVYDGCVSVMVHTYATFVHCPFVVETVMCWSVKQFAKATAYTQTSTTCFTPGHCCHSDSVL